MRRLPSFTEFYRVLPSFTEFHSFFGHNEVFTEFYRVFFSMKCCWTPLFSGVRLASEFYRVLPSFTEFYRVFFSMKCCRAPLFVSGLRSAFRLPSFTDS